MARKPTNPFIDPSGQPLDLERLAQEIRAESDDRLAQRVAGIKSAVSKAGAAAAAEAAAAKPKPEATYVSVAAQWPASPPPPPVAAVKPQPTSQPKREPSELAGPTPADADTVWNALVVAGCSRSRTWLPLFMGELGLSTSDGQPFTAAQVHVMLGQLVRERRVHIDAGAGYDVKAADRAAALPQLMQQPWAQDAWKAWAQACAQTPQRSSASHYDYQMWQLREAGRRLSGPRSGGKGHLIDVPAPSYLRGYETTALLRLMLYGGLPLDHLNQLQREWLFVNSVEDLWSALCSPFMPALWEQADPELQDSLVQSIVAAGVVQSPQFVPLLQWLDQQNAPPASAQALPPALRTLFIERSLYRGDTATAASVCTGHNQPVAGLLQATLLARAGQWASAAAAVPEALKEAAKSPSGLASGGSTTGNKKRGYASPRLMQLALMALMSTSDPAAWAAARKLCVQESGSRNPPPERGWGLWAHIIGVRLGDVSLQEHVLDGPREAVRGLVKPGTTQTIQPWPAEMAAMLGEDHADRLLLAAWLGEPSAGTTPATVQRSHQALVQGGLHHKADLLLAAAQRLSVAPTNLLSEQKAGAADLPTTWADNFFGQRREAWRDALAAIEALGADPKTAAGPSLGSAPLLQWRLRIDRHGRVRDLQPFERPPGARGLGKPKLMTLARLKKAVQLPPQDAAVARYLRAPIWASRNLYLDCVAATQALIGHPGLVFDDNPEQPVDLREGLPQLEVLRQQAADGTESFVFHLADPLLPPPETLDGGPDDLTEDLDDQTDESPDQQSARIHSVRVVRDAPDRARLIRINPAQRRVAELVAKQWAVPVQAKAELEAALRVLAGHFLLHSDATAGQDVPSEPRLRAVLGPLGDGLQLRLVVQPFGAFGPAVLPAQGRPRLLALHEGLTLATLRDLTAEALNLAAVLEALPQLSDASDMGDFTWQLPDPEAALAVLEQLPQLPQLAGVDWPRGKPVRVQAVQADALKLKVSSGRDWLGLNGELQLDEGRVLSLQQLLDLAHASRRGRFIALGDGEYLALTEQLKRQLADLHSLAHADPGGGVKLPPVAASWLSETLGSTGIKGDAAWLRQLSRLDAAAALQPEPPPALQAQLRSYQAEGYAWMVRLAHAGLGACLADDMGLGKTVQTLALLLHRAGDGPALVLAPTSVCSNWAAEASRFAPSLRVLQYGVMGEDGLSDAAAAQAQAQADADELVAQAGPDGAEAKTSVSAAVSNTSKLRRLALRQLGPGDVVVASYALLQIDADAFAPVAWHTVVMDEAQALKNAATQRARAAAALKADFKLALTGTPVENRLADLWSLMHLLNPGLLGTANRFAERFGTPIEREGDNAARQRLRRLVSPFLLRRTKAQVLTDLPPRTEIVHRVQPGPQEQAFLEAARRAAVDRVAQAAEQSTLPGGQASFQVLAELTRLRRAACDPRLVAPELGIVGAKVHEFEQLATELVAGRHKALVFSQFTDFLALLGDRLKACGLSYQYLDGSTPAAERGKRVAAFQRGEGDLFLISLKAGGFGLNLTAADYVIIVDPWWNPAAEDQALGRAHRIGQQRPVTVYRLVTAGSVEEKIIELHSSKRSLADGILEGQDQSQAIGAAELRALLSDD